MMSVQRLQKLKDVGCPNLCFSFVMGVPEYLPEYYLH